jgi:hypothetical protein
VFVCTGPLSASIIVAAKNLLDDKRNFRKRYTGNGRTRQLAMVLFNRRKFAFLPGQVGVELDAPRTRM